MMICHAVQDTRLNIEVTSVTVLQRRYNGNSNSGILIISVLLFCAN